MTKMHWTSLWVLMVLVFWGMTAEAGPLRITYVLQNDAATPGSASDIILGTDTLAPITLEGTVGSTFATTTARVQHGSLGLYASVNGAATIVSELDFDDTLTLVSDTLPIGTPVNLAIALDLQYSLSSEFCGDGTGVARIGAYVRLANTFLQFADDSCDGIQLDDTFAVMTFAIGDVLDLNAQLDVTAAAGNCCDVGTATADALHTLRFFVDPQGADFGYTSLTGATYLTPSPVPEPASLWLLTSGVVGLLVRQRRRL